MRLQTKAPIRYRRHVTEEKDRDEHLVRVILPKSNISDIPPWAFPGFFVDSMIACSCLLYPKECCGVQHPRSFTPLAGCGALQHQGVAPFERFRGCITLSWAQARVWRYSWPWNGVCSSGAFGANAPVVLKAPMVYDSGTMGYWCSLGALPCWLSKPGLLQVCEVVPLYGAPSVPTWSGVGQGEAWRIKPVCVCVCVCVFVSFPKRSYRDVTWPNAKSNMLKHCGELHTAAVLVCSPVHGSALLSFSAAWWNPWLTWTPYGEPKSVILSIHSVSFVCCIVVYVVCLAKILEQFCDALTKIQNLCRQRWVAGTWACRFQVWGRRWLFYAEWHCPTQRAWRSLAPMFFAPLAGCGAFWC